MTHTFFKNNQYQVIKEIDQSPFTVQYAWQYESTQLELVFDPTEEGWDELVENLENGTWTHMVAKVAVLYDGQEIGTEYLGSGLRRIMMGQSLTWLKLLWTKPGMSAYED